MDHFLIKEKGEAETKRRLLQRSNRGSNECRDPTGGGSLGVPKENGAGRLEQEFAFFSLLRNGRLAPAPTQPSHLDE